MMRLAGRILLAVTLVFLLGPFIVILMAGLEGGDVLQFPPQTLSLRWFIEVFQIESIRTGLYLSLWLAVGSTLAALILGVPAAYALSRYNPPGAELARTILVSPVVVPAIIVGLALLRYLVVPLGIPVRTSLFLAHTALLTPYAVRVVGASLENLRADMEEAAVLLGATRLGAFMKVVLPNIRDGVLAAFILGVVTSFNQVPASLFLTGPGVATLPISMLSYMEFHYDPSVAAMSALLALGSTVLVLAAERALGVFRYV